MASSDQNKDTIATVTCINPMAYGSTDRFQEIFERARKLVDGFRGRCRLGYADPKLY